MKNNKGFTLIEILASVIILGIISIFAVNTFTKNMRGFRDDYYTDLSRTMEKSGQEFFNDNRNYRPGQILGAQKVSISALETNKYLKDIVDYNGDKCDASKSYVLIVKEGRDDYSYHSCLVCSEDNYDNTSDKYCDSAWLNPNTITYGIGAAPTLYVYKGTNRDEVKEKLEIPVSYVRKNSKGEVLQSVRGNGEDNLPTILPVDMDKIDTNKLGTYTVHYEYKHIKSGSETEEIERQEGKVIVYENDAPNLSIRYKDTVAKQGATLDAVRNNTTDIIEGNYVSGEWHQEITVTLSPKPITEPGVTPSRYQWRKKEGKWVDFCTTNNSCSVYLPDDMNEIVEFRMIDTNGKISQFTTPINIRRDNTKPTCTVQETGTIGDDLWYLTDVDVNFTVNKDLPSTYEEAISGLKVNNLAPSYTIINRNVDRKTNKQTVDVATITYIGYIEDHANNYSTCAVTFKRDVTPPVCELQTAGTVGDNSWFTENVVVSFKTHSDNMSGVRRYGIGNNDETGVHEYTHTQDTTSVTYNAHIRDIAGNTNDCSINFKKDATPPVCTMKITGDIGDNGWYYNKKVKVEFDVHSDATSGVAQYGIDGLTKSKTLDQTDGENIKHTGYIKDNAGLQSTCDTITFKQDATKPTCKYTGDSTTWTASNRTITWSCEDNLSGCNKSFFDSNSYEYTTSTKTATIGSYNIKDLAGNQKTCDAKTVNVYVDKDNPECDGIGKCKDSHSGCKTVDLNTLSDGKITIYDNVNHSVKCTYVVDKSTSWSYTGNLSTFEVDIPLSGYYDQGNATSNNGTVACSFSTNNAHCTGSIGGIAATNEDGCYIANGYSGNVLYYNGKCFSKSGHGPYYTESDNWNCGSKASPLSPGADHHCPYEVSNNPFHYCTSGNNNCVTGGGYYAGTKNGHKYYACNCFAANGNNTYYAVTISISYRGTP